MGKKNLVFLIIFSLLIFIFFYFKYLNQKKMTELIPQISDDIIYNSNIIEDVKKIISMIICDISIKKPLHVTNDRFLNKIQ